MMDETTAALNRIAAALERLADVYLYVNDPEQDRPDVDDMSAPASLSLDR